MMEQLHRDEDVLVSEHEYDDEVVYVADLGVHDGASADVVDGTVIVVAGDDQYEVELPAEADARAFIKNGVLTIEVTQ